MTIHRGQTTTRASTVAQILQAVPLKAVVRTRVAERIWPSQPAHGLALLALTHITPTIARDDGTDPLHVTLAHALPLALDPAWRSWAEDNCAFLVAGGQLVTVYADDLVAADPREATTRRHRRLHRRHQQTTARDHDDIDGFLADWVAFTTWRYGQTPPDLQREALQRVLVMSGCRVRDFHQEGELIARSVVANHKGSRTMFDLMAVWWPRHHDLRPGIYSAVYNLHDAQRRGLRFSLCYGRFPYKDHVLGDLPRLSLADLGEHPRANYTRRAAMIRLRLSSGE